MTAATYRALRFERFGEPADVLRPGPVRRRSAGAGQVRIACAAVGLNFLDVLLCRGEYPVRPPFPAVPGVEVAGRVVEAGPGAEALLGRPVLACPALPDGALGEEVVVDAALVVERPDGVPAEVAAALPVTYQTAWFALERARLRAGETVLVHAGAGGVGTATIQLARRAGARVIAVAGGAAKTAWCLGQGAAAAIDHTEQDVAAELARIAGGDGVDVVVDPVGGPMTDLSLAALRFEGRYVAVGLAGGAGARIDPARLMAANVDVIGLSWGSRYPWERPDRVRDVYARLFDAILDGTVRPAIGGTYTLDEAPAALRELAARRSTGKLVVRITDQEDRP